MRITGLFFLLLGAFTTTLFGQEISTVYTQYTVEEGMPSNDINYVMQDSKGYIWMLGDGRLTRFNGTDFHEIQLGGFVNKMVEDSRGDYWLSAMGALALMRDSRIGIHGKYRAGILKSTSSKNFIHHITEDSLGNVWYTVNNGTTNGRKGQFSDEVEFITAYKLGEDSVEAVNLMEDKDAFRIGSIGFVKRIPGGNYIFTGRSFKQNNQDKVFTRENIDFNTDQFIYPIIKFIELHDGTFVAISCGEIMHFTLDKIFFYSRFHLGTNLTSLFQDSKENVWLGTMDGLWRAPKGDFSKLEKMDKQPDFYITSINEDTEGNIWLSTLGAGVLKVSGNDFEKISWKNDLLKSRIEEVVTHKGEMWISTLDGTVVKFDKKLQGSIQHSPQTAVGHRLISVGDTLLSAHRRMYFDGKMEVLGKLKGREAFPTEFFNILVHKGGGNVWVANARNMFLFNLHKQEVIYDAQKEGFKDQVYSLSLDSEKNLWFASGNGKLYRLKDREIMNAAKIYPQLDSITDMGFIGSVTIGLHDHIYLTYHDGVVILTPDGVQKIRSTSDLTASKNHVLNYLEEDESLWISGFGGVDKFIYDPESKKYIKSTFFGTKHGLPVISNGKMCYYNDKIFLGTSDGLYIIKPENLTRNNVPPVPVHITKFQVQDSVFRETESLELAHYLNSPTFHIDGISFQKEKKLYFKYRLLGQSEEWLTTESKDIPYNDLKPGNYTFQVYGIRGNYDDIKGDESKLTTLSFKIVPHFTQTWFFITAMFALAAILLAYAVYAYVRWKDRQERRQMLTTELKYQALQSQMSPHFIFNAMNSISYLVKNKKSKAADKYLNQFAGLLRGVLENAQYSFITLLDEMELVQTYLELEQLQFGKQFQFSIDMDPELMAFELQLPPMLIQPVIENAIRHGISPRGYGTVHVNFKDKDKHLEVSIQDDGVGRAFAEKLKKQSLTQTSKTQVGIKNIRERINVLNHLYGLNMKMEIADLEDEGTSTGTQVTFTFPKIKYLPEIENSSFTSFQSFSDSTESEEYQKD